MSRAPLECLARLERQEAQGPRVRGETLVRLELRASLEIEGPLEELQAWFQGPRAYQVATGPSEKLGRLGTRGSRGGRG